MNESYKVICSCTKIAIISRTDNKFTTNLIGWKYRTSSEAEAYESVNNTYIKAGWYCGQEHHYQESSRELSQLCRT